MGKSIRRAPVSSNMLTQFGDFPCTWASAADSRNRRMPPSLRLSVPITLWSSPYSSNDSWMPTVSTGCGLDSMNVR